MESLGIGDSVHVKDLELPKGVEVLVDPEISVVHVVAPRLEITVEEEPEEVPEGEAEAEAEGEKPEGEKPAAPEAPEAGE